MAGDASACHSCRVNIRRARDQESEQIADLWLRSRRASVPDIPPPAHSDDEVRDWFRDVVVPHREVWLASREDDRELLGLLVLHGDWVDQLYVAPECVGGGIGSRLLDVAKTARPAGLQLWTFESNLGARRFYERHGFVRVERTDGDNEEGAPDLRYTWQQ